MLLAGYRPPRRLRHGQRDLRVASRCIPGLARDQETHDWTRSVNDDPSVNTFVLSALAVLVAYLVGAIPFGYLVTHWVKGIDIRTVGSGNVAATNVGRTLGFRYFVLVFLLDMLKGFLPTLGFPWLLEQ